MPVGESSSLAVAIKTSESENMYGFNNESYAFYPNYDPQYNTLWSKPDFEIGSDKKYRVCIKILAAGHEYTEEFILLNPRKRHNSIHLAKIEKEEC